MAKDLKDPMVADMPLGDQRISPDREGELDAAIVRVMELEKELRAARKLERDLRAARARSVAQPSRAELGAFGLGGRREGR